MFIEIAGLNYYQKMILVQLSSVCSMHSERKQRVTTCYLLFRQSCLYFHMKFFFLLDSVVSPTFILKPVLLYLSFTVLRLWQSAERHVQFGT